MVTLDKYIYCSKLKCLGAFITVFIKSFYDLSVFVLKVSYYWVMRLKMLGFIYNFKILGLA